MSRPAFLDGPLQRQMILMKLVHEMDHRPEFGSRYDGNPDGCVQRWIARVSALMNRVSIEKGVTFRAAISTSAQYWVSAIGSAQRCVREAIEELKLELELYHDDQIGKVFDSNSRYQFGTEFRKICSEARNDVFVVDPYFDESVLELVDAAHPEALVRVLLNKNFGQVCELSRRFAEDRKRSVELRKSKEIHDRILFLDQEQCWVFGASVKDGGKKPTYLMPLPLSLSSEKFIVYQEIWGRSIH